MHKLKWWSLVLLLLVSSVVFPQAQAVDTAPSLTRIGRGAVQSVEWHPSGNYVLVSTVRGAWLYTPDLEDLTHIPDAHFATLSPDGRYLAAIDDTSRPRLWDAETFEVLDVLNSGHFYRVEALSWSPDGQYLAVAGNRDEDRIEVWDFRDISRGGFLARFSADKLLWSPEGRHLAAMDTSSASFSVFNIREKTTTFQYQPTRQPPYGADMTWQDENHLLTLGCYEDTESTLWNVLNGEQVTQRKFANCTPMVYSKRGELAIGGTSNNLRLIRGNASEATVVEIEWDVFGAFTLEWSNHDRWLALGPYNSSQISPAEVAVVDTDTNEVLHVLSGAEQTVQHLAWSSDDQRLLVVDERQQIFIYDMGSGERLAYNDLHTLVGDTLAWRPDGTQFVLAGRLDTVTLWDTEQVTEVHRFSDTAASMTTIKWQPNGDLIAVQAREASGSMSPGAPLTFKIWNTRTFENVTADLGLASDDTNNFFDWHPEGDQLAIIARNTLQIRDAGTGAITVEASSTPELNLSSSTDLSWSPSGKYIIALMLGYGTGGSYVYSLDTDSFTLSSAEQLHGATLWSPDDKLISLSWGTWGDPTPPRSITPGLMRLVEPYFYASRDNPRNTFFGLKGLTTSTRQGFLSPKGNYAAAIDDTGSGMLWDATTGEPLAMLANTAQVVWSPDENLLVTQREDGSLWLLETNNRIPTPFPVTVSLQEAAGHFFWSPDGRHLAHLHNGVVDLWQLVN